VFPEFDNLSHIYDFPDHMAGDQKWKGAADTLNKYPTDIISKAKLKY
jgi:hypothetical protein